MQHLENKLGSALFHRHPRGGSLTSSGETILRYAEQILNLCHEAERAVQDTETPSGTLRIGAMETTTATRLPAILAEYHEEFPDVKLSLTTGPTNHLVDAVFNYDVEAAFVAGPVDHPLLEEVAAIQEELVSSPVQAVQICNPQAANLPFLAFREGFLYRKRLDQYLDHVRMKSRNVIELGTLDGILGWVAVGLGIAASSENCHRAKPISRYVQTKFQTTSAKHQLF